MEKIVFIALIILFANSLTCRDAYSKEFINQKNMFIKTNGDRVLNKIIVKGNKKTRNSVVINKVNIKAGDPISGFDPEGLVQELRRLNLYTSITINYIPREDNLVDIEIDLYEKLSLIPIPFMRFSEGSSTYALIILERNFLGYHKNLMVGGFLQTDGFTYMASYMDPSVMNTKYTFAVMNLVGDREIEQSDIEENIYRKYFVKVYMTSARIGYKFKNKWKLTIRGKYTNSVIDKDHAEGLNSPDSGKYYEPGLGLEYDNMYFDEIFNYGLKTKIEYGRGVAVSEGQKDFNKTYAKIKYRTKIFNGHRMSFDLSGGTGNMPVILFKQLSGSPGYRTLPFGKIFSDQYFGGALGYEMPLYKGEMITSTVIGFYEGGGARNNNEDKMEYFHGPGCGLKFYLKRIAMPAIGFYVANNVKTGNTILSLSIGFSF